MRGIKTGQDIVVSYTNWFYIQTLQEKFEDAKGVIRIRKVAKRKRTINNLQNIHIKLKIE